MESTIEPGVADAEVRRLVDTLAKVDELFDQAEDMILASRSHSPFNPYLTRLTEDKAKVVADAISEVRTAMLCALRLAGVPADAASHVNLDWAVRSTLVTAAQLLDELPSDLPRRNSRMPIAGHGGVDPIVRMREVLAEVNHRLTPNG